ncbi:MAG: pyridoxamine 5'-phosphate oxidase family protein [Pseudomonadota bacterium]
MRWDDTLEGIETTLWDALARGVGDPRAAARRPALATIGADGGPEARIVVLRGVDRARGICTFYTDSASTKVSELAADPRAAMHIWEHGLKLQTRLRGPCTRANDAQEDAAWAAEPDMSLGNYGVTPAPGTPIDAFDAFERIPARARFAVMHLEVRQIDAVILADDIHRRAQYRRTDTGWERGWLAP